jgi:ribosomal RNA-processing protein 1
MRCRRPEEKFMAIQLTPILIVSEFHDKFSSSSLFPEFTNNDFLRLWKGLYYCMWMSDKPLVQEELAEDLGSLVHCFPDVKVGIQFFRNFLETMCLEWFGIDQWRIDKFMMVSNRIQYDLGSSSPS